MSAQEIEKLFLQAYGDYANAIFRHCYFRVRDRELARDLTQEVFLRTWRTLNKGTVIENLRAFLYKVALNLIIDHSQSQKRRTLSLEALAEDGFEPGVDEHERWRDFLDGAAALERLGAMEAKYRDAIYLRYVAGLSPREIAEALGESENLVSVRIHRGLKKLRAILERPES